MKKAEQLKEWRSREKDRKKLMQADENVQGPPVRNRDSMCLIINNLLSNTL